jgi:glutamate dehydrogenase
VRVDGRDLRCKVVGEGGNLGFTQRGRVEYSLNGGAINTDAIDNQGGVNCSDREVNIKILLGAARRTRRT